MTEHKNMPDNPSSGKSTEHRCEWLMGTRAKGEWYIHEPVARCADKNCDILLNPDEIERILNDHSTLKRATDVLSAEDANTIARGLETLAGFYPFNENKENIIEFSNTMDDYARILSPTDDISSTKER